MRALAPLLALIAACSFSRTDGEPAVDVDAAITGDDPAVSAPPDDNDNVNDPEPVAPCGAVGQGCCATGPACHAGAECTGGTCTACGGQFESCCDPGATCRGVGVCLGGTCATLGG